MPGAGGAWPATTGAERRTTCRVRLLKTHKIRLMSEFLIQILCVFRGALR